MSGWVAKIRRKTKSFFRSAKAISGPYGGREGKQGGRAPGYRLPEQDANLLLPASTALFAELASRAVRLGDTGDRRRAARMQA